MTLLLVACMQYSRTVNQHLTAYERALSKIDEDEALALRYPGSLREYLEVGQFKDFPPRSDYAGRDGAPGKTPQAVCLITYYLPALPKIEPCESQ